LSSIVDVVHKVGCQTLKRWLKTFLQKI